MWQFFLLGKYGGGFDDSQNEENSNVDVDNDNSNSDNPEAMAGEQRYCWFAGTIFVKNKPSSYYDSNSGDPEWGIMREGNHQQVRIQIQIMFLTVGGA